MVEDEDLTPIRQGYCDYNLLDIIDGKQNKRTQKVDEKEKEKTEHKLLVREIKCVDRKKNEMKAKKDMVLI